MAKQRQDASYIKWLARISKKMAETLTALPLVLIQPKDRENLTEYSKSKMGDHIVLSVEFFDETVARLPVSKFLVLDTGVDVNVQNGQLFNHNYFCVDYSEEENNLSLMFYTKGNELGVLTLIKSDDDIQIKCMLVTSTITEANEDQTKFMVTLYAEIGLFLKMVEEGDRYPISGKGVQHRKAHAKKPWTRKDLVTIQYLNALPAEHKPHKGGTHASPCYHQRRGSWRPLTHKRYRNHPKYGEKIYVKPYWAGDKSRTVNGVTYTVL